MQSLRPSPDFKSDCHLFALSQTRVFCEWPTDYAGQIFLQCIGDASVLTASATALKAAASGCDVTLNGLTEGLAGLQNSAWDDSAEALKKLANSGLQIHVTKVQAGNAFIVPPGFLSCMLAIDDSSVAGATSTFFDSSESTVKNLQVIYEAMPEDAPGRAPLGAWLAARRPDDLVS